MICFSKQTVFLNYYPSNPWAFSIKHQYKSLSYGARGNGNWVVVMGFWDKTQEVTHLPDPQIQNLGFTDDDGPHSDKSKRGQEKESWLSTLWKGRKGVPKEIKTKE